MQNHGCACWCTFLLDYVSPAVFVWLSHVLLLTLALNWMFALLITVYYVCIAHWCLKQRQQAPAAISCAVWVSCCYLQVWVFFAELWTGAMCSVGIVFGNFGWFFCGLLSQDTSAGDRNYDRSIWCAIGLWCHCFGHLQTGPLGIRHPVFLLTMHAHFSPPFLTTVCFIVTYIITVFRCRKHFTMPGMFFLIAARKIFPEFMFFTWQGDKVRPLQFTVFSVYRTGCSHSSTLRLVTSCQDDDRSLLHDAFQGIASWSDRDRNDT